MPDQYFSLVTFAQLGTAAVLVYVIVNGIRYFLGFYRRWIVLAVSFVVIIVGESVSKTWTDVGALPLLLLTVGNTFLLSFTAIGLNETVAKGSKKPEADQYAIERKLWVSSWF